MASLIDQPKGSYLIRGGSVITVDPKTGTLPCADVLVRDGKIEKVGSDIIAEGIEIIDASGMIVMPGFIDSHYHMWSTLGRNFVSDDFGYFPAKWATAEFYDAGDFYASVRLGLADLANSGVTTVHNWSHNNRSPRHLDAELRAHQESGLRARYSMGHIDKLPVDQLNTFEDLPRVQEEWFADPSRLKGLTHLGVNLRGAIQSNVDVFYREMEKIMKIGLPVSIHASQSAPNSDIAEDYESRGFLGPKFLFCHYIAATESDRQVLARTRTPLSYATLSELRLGETGDARAALMKMRAAGVLISLSSDASSIAPPNMLEALRATWNLAVPWAGTDTESFPPLGFHEAIEMATINGARSLGLGDVTGSLTVGKQADIILIRTEELNIAPIAHVETTVVMSANASNIDTVMVDGRILKRHGKLLGVDIPDVIGEAKRSALRIRTAAGGILTPQCADCAANAVFRASAC